MIGILILYIESHLKGQSTPSHRINDFLLLVFMKVDMILYIRGWLSFWNCRLFVRNSFFHFRGAFLKPQAIGIMMALVNENTKVNRKNSIQDETIYFFRWSISESRSIFGILKATITTIKHIKKFPISSLMHGKKNWAFKTNTLYTWLS